MKAKEAVKGKTIKIRGEEVMITSVRRDGDKVIIRGKSQLATHTRVVNAEQDI